MSLHFEASSYMLLGAVRRQHRRSPREEAAVNPDDQPRRCPDDHEVPSWRTTCGVCGAPMPGGATVAPEDEPAEETVARRRGPSPLAWVGLGLLAVSALAIPFLQDDIVLADDFAQPEVLRTWPETEGSLEYRDGTYHVL